MTFSVLMSHFTSATLEIQTIPKGCNSIAQGETLGHITNLTRQP
jgi:hypothetical protein